MEIAPFGCFCGNYIISGTISCVHKNRMMNCSKNSSSGFYFGLGVFSQPQTKDAIDNIFETIALLTTPMYRNNDNEF